MIVQQVKVARETLQGQEVPLLEDMVVYGETESCDASNYNGGFSLKDKESIYSKGKYSAYSKGMNKSIYESKKIKTSIYNTRAIREEDQEHLKQDSECKQDEAPPIVVDDLNEST